MNTVACPIPSRFEGNGVEAGDDVNTKFLSLFFLSFYWTRVQLELWTDVRVSTYVGVSGSPEKYQYGKCADLLVWRWVRY